MMPIKKKRVRLSVDGKNLDSESSKIKSAPFTKHNVSPKSFKRKEIEKFTTIAKAEVVPLTFE